MKTNRRIVFVGIYAAVGMLACQAESGTLENLLNSPNQRPVETTGLPDTDNHDGSNVVFYNGRYYFWFTEHYAKDYYGFVGTRIEYVTSPDGLHWGKRKIAIEPDPSRKWETKGVLTPYVVIDNDRFYLFYTAVNDEFGQTMGGGPKRILYAVASSPEGPWERPENNLVLESNDVDGWEGVGPDDANIVFRDGKWWLYYKGRRKDCKRWLDTEIGVAFADSPVGPYERYEKNPLGYGHALCAWKEGDGVAMLFSNGRDNNLYWAEDGLHFEPYGRMRGATAGVYCPDNFKEGASRGIRWGIDTAAGDKNEIAGKYTNTVPKSNRVQQRFDCDLWLDDALPSPAVKSKPHLFKADDDIPIPFEKAVIRQPPLHGGKGDAWEGGKLF